MTTIFKNVMLEYTFDEAKEVLETQLKQADDQLKNIAENMDYLKDQITITEVAMARCHNHEVMEKRKTDAEANRNALNDKFKKELRS